MQLFSFLAGVTVVGGVLEVWSCVIYPLRRRQLRTEIQNSFWIWTLAKIVDLDAWIQIFSRPDYSLL